MRSSRVALGLVGGVCVIAPGLSFGQPPSDPRFEMDGFAAALDVAVQRVSRPGCRIYCGKDQIPRVYGGLGINILSTSRGLMTGRSAAREGVGGEILCNVW